MRNRLLEGLVVIVLGLVVAGSVQAAAFQADERWSIEDEIADDVYFAGESLDINVRVNGDVTAAGERLEIKREVTGDVNLVGKSIRVEGVVGDDVHAGGESVIIDGRINDDVLLVGADVVLGTDSEIGGSAFLAGQNIEVNGKVSGSVMAAGAYVIVGSGAVIEGDLITYGEEPRIAEGGVINGQRRHEAGVKPDDGRFRILSWVQSVVTWFVLAIVLLYVSRKWSRKIVLAVRTQSMRSVITGLVWLVGFLPVSVLLLATGVGWPIGVALFLGTLALILVAHGFGVLAIGNLIYEKVFKQSGEMNWQHALLGAVTLKLVDLIPGLGWLLSLVLVILLLGIMLNLKWKELRT